MDVVVDASIAASWLLVDEHNANAEAVLNQVRKATGHVPPLFWHETQNLLLKAERRGRCGPGEADTFMRRLRAIRLQVSLNRSDEVVLSLARTHGLSAYDAAYLDLAVSMALPLATADRRLALATVNQGVAILGPHAPSP